MKNVEMKFLSGTKSGNILSFHANVFDDFFCCCVVHSTPRHRVICEMSWRGELATTKNFRNSSSPAPSLLAHSSTASKSTTQIDIPPIILDFTHQTCAITQREMREKRRPTRRFCHFPNPLISLAAPKAPYSEEFRKFSL